MGTFSTFFGNSAAREEFAFLEPGRLVDGELELVTPEARWIDDQLAACHDPLTMRLMPFQARTTREQLLFFLQVHPHGHSRGDCDEVPAYHFWMRLLPESRPPLPMAGSVSLRVGHTSNLELYLGHIGYHVFPATRGRHYAERACRLLLPLARAHGLKTLWITCNPDNLPSRRTCERLGATLIDTLPVPRSNPLYAQGDREKCRYRLAL